MKLKAKNIVMIGMLSAIAYIMVFTIRIPVVLFLKYEPKDVIIVIGGFIMGPLSALLISVVSSFLELITFSQDGVIGFVMNVMASASFACTASYLYSKKHTIKGAIIGLVSGVIVMTIVMVVWNYLVTPIYMQVPRQAVVDLLVPAIVPFNLIKGVLNAGFSILLYRAIASAFKKSGLIETKESNSIKQNLWGMYAVASLVVVSAILVVLAMNGTI